MNWDERAKACLAQGCLTYSKRSDQFVKGVYPTHVDDINMRNVLTGCYLKTDEGSYIDFVAGLGSNLIGCNNNFTLPSHSEIVLAEKLKTIFPFIDKMRFLKTGSEACQAAIRIARSFGESIKHRKKIILGLGYHGWHSVFISVEKPGAGTFYEHYFKFDSIDKIIDFINNHTQPDSIAGVIVEPVMLDLNVKNKLKKLRNICTNKKIVLIFDEIITGFRFPQYCVSNYLGITPDIICLGKAVANGHPLSIVGGKKKYMDAPDYFISSTFAGETTSIREALAVLGFVSIEKMQELWDRGKWFRSEFNKISPKIQLNGYPTRAVWQAEETYKAIFWQEMIKRGYLFGKAFFLMFSHTREILEATLNDSKEVIANMDNNKLEGDLPREVFKRT